MGVCHRAHLEARMTPRAAILVLTAYHQRLLLKRVTLAAYRRGDQTRASTASWMRDELARIVQEVRS